MYHPPMSLPIPEEHGTEWIDELTDEECMEVFWLYVDPPEPFLQAYPPRLLGDALRFALKAVCGAAGGGI